MSDRTPSGHCMVIYLYGPTIRVRPDLFVDHTVTVYTD